MGGEEEVEKEIVCSGFPLNSEEFSLFLSLSRSDLCQRVTGREEGVKEVKRGAKFPPQTFFPLQKLWENAFVMMEWGGGRRKRVSALTGFFFCVCGLQNLN